MNTNKDRISGWDRHWHVFWMTMASTLNQSIGPPAGYCPISTVKQPWPVDSCTPLFSSKTSTEDPSQPSDQEEVLPQDPIYWSCLWITFDYCFRVDYCLITAFDFCFRDALVKHAHIFLLAYFFLLTSTLKDKLFACCTIHPIYYQVEWITHTYTHAFISLS